MPDVKYIYSRLLALHLLCATLLAACGAPPAESEAADATNETLYDYHLEDPLDLEDLEDEENVAWLLRDKTRPLPETYYGGIWECDVPFHDACIWFHVPDAIVVGEVLAARKTARAYNRPFGPDNAAGVKRCPDNSRWNFSIEITIRVDARIKGPEDIHDDRKVLTFLVNSSAMRHWSAFDEIRQRAMEEDGYVLGEHIVKGQTLGATLFRLGDGWATSKTGLFSLVENADGDAEVALQATGPCDSFSPLRGTAFRELLETIKQCPQELTPREEHLREYFLSAMDRENLSMSKCR